MPISSEECFMRQVRKAESGCWEWTGYVTPAGYAKYSQSRAHRWAYERWVGPIPAGLQLDHLCRNRKCVNPEHLEPVTNRENVLRGDSAPAENARKTHCTHGHVLGGDNLGIRANGSRVCKRCVADRGRQWKIHRRNAAEHADERGAQ